MRACSCCSCGHHDQARLPQTMFHGKRSFLGRRNSRARHARGFWDALRGPAPRRVREQPGLALWTCGEPGSAPGQPAAAPEYPGPLPPAPGRLRGSLGPRRRPSVPETRRCSLGAVQRWQSAPTSRGSNAPRPSPRASAARCQPSAQPTHPGLLAAPGYSPAPRDLRGCGLLQLQVLREVKAKLPRDTLLNPRGTGLRKTPFSPSEAGSFRLGLYPVSFAGKPSAPGWDREGPLWVLFCFVFFCMGAS